MSMLIPPQPSDELFQNYPAGLLVFATAACIVFILVGIPGNLITIIALARCKKVTNFFPTEFLIKCIVFCRPFVISSYIKMLRTVFLHTK